MVHTHARAGLQAVGHYWLETEFYLCQAPVGQSLCDLHPSTASTASLETWYVRPRRQKLSEPQGPFLPNLDLTTLHFDKLSHIHTFIHTIFIIAVRIVEYRRHLRYLLVPILEYNVHQPRLPTRLLDWSLQATPTRVPAKGKKAYDDLQEPL
jgi:hypothetical protein